MEPLLFLVVLQSCEYGRGAVLICCESAKTMAIFIQMAPLRTGSDHLGGWWYLRFSHSYRNVEELLSERGLPARHTTSGDRSTAMRPN